MLTSSRSLLGQVLRDARAHKGLSQEDLMEQLSLARPISISKWERGEAPVPVHHWVALMRILGVSRQDFLDAARQDHHRQLPLFLSLTSSLGEASGVEAFTWDFVLKKLAPTTALEIERLCRQYPDLTPLEFTKAAFQYFLRAASLGLDRNNQPIRLIDTSTTSSGPRPEPEPKHPRGKPRKRAR